MQKRYSLIYQPKGRAREYGEYAANIYKGCPHSSRYCYVPRLVRRTRADFHHCARPVTDCLARLSRGCVRLAHERGLGCRIFLCFTCDPFPYSNCEMLQSPGEYGTQVIRIIKDAGHNVRLLTKGWIPNSTLDLLDEHDELGVTLTCQERLSSELWEPGALSPDLRWSNLISAHGRGIRTFVSFEPVLEPDSVYALIRRTQLQVDRYAIGKANHLADWDWPDARSRCSVESIDWPGFALRVAELCRLLEKPYRLKDDLAAHLPAGMEHLRQWDSK